MPNEFGTPQVNEMVYVRQILMDIKKTVTSHKKEVEIKLSKLNDDVDHIRSSVDRLGIGHLVGDIKELIQDMGYHNHLEAPEGFFLFFL